MLVDRQPTTVLFVACADELPEIRAAWERLEAVAPLRGEPPEVYDRIAGAVEALGPGDPARPSSSTTAAATRSTCSCRCSVPDQWR